jgi:beta-phosphoglucomutase-like phosphatase (HAD superfamily)
LKEAYLDEAFQEIQARRCSNNKPEPKTFRRAVEKQAGRSYAV